MAWDTRYSSLIDINWATPPPQCTDPYLCWADVSAFAPVGGVTYGPLVPVLLELTKPAHEVGDEKFQNAGARIAKSYLQVNDSTLASCTYCSAEVSPSFLKFPPVWVKRLTLGAARLANCQLPTENFTEIGFEFGKKISPLVGVIDDGLAFAHPKFVARTIAFYNQENSCTLFQNDIQSRLATNRTRAQDIYDQSTALVPLQSHGTAVMYLASVDVNNKDISCLLAGVQLPVRTVQDASGGSLSVHILDGIRYICDLAATISSKIKPYPVVINISFGAIAGSHDGTSMLECAIDQVLEKRKHNTAIVIPAGNARGTNTNAAFELAPGGEHQLIWNISYNDKTDSFVEIWVDDAQGIEVQLTWPDGLSSGYLKKGDCKFWQPDSGCPLAGVIFLGKTSHSNSKQMCLLAIAPTSGQSRNEAPSGAWKIDIKNSALKNSKIQAWIERDGKVFGRDSGGQQSYFSNIPNSGVGVATSLNSLGNGANTIVVGAYRISDGLPCDYSGAEENLPDVNSLAPTLCAPGDEGDSRYDYGISVPESWGGSSFRLSGTSVAAPQVTAWIANYMHENIGSNGNMNLWKKLYIYAAKKFSQNQTAQLKLIENNVIKSALTAQAKQDEQELSETPDGSLSKPQFVNRIGAGRLKRR